MRNGIDLATRTDIVWLETLGLLVLLLTVLRLIWMAFRPTTPQFAMAGWMQPSAKFVRFVFWVLLLALAITAFLALGIQISTSPLRPRYMPNWWHMVLLIMSPVVSARLSFNRRWRRPLLLGTTILMQVILCRPQLAWP